VFVEKPLALSRAEADRAIAACAAAGVVLAVGHNRRFLPAFEELLAEAQSGALGRILHLEANFSGSFGFDYRPGMWRASAAESPGGGMTLMGVHMLDLMIALCGPVESVSAESTRQVLQIELDDTTAALLRFRSGARGYLGTLTATPRIWRLQAMGTQGWVQLLDHHLVDRMGSDGQRRAITHHLLDVERAELEEFAAACEGAATYRVPLADVAHGISVMEAAFRSIAADGARQPVLPSAGSPPHVR
jgi:predicted dehydrogenase